MILNLSHVHHRVDFWFSGLRPTSAHRPDLRHVLTIFLFTSVSFFRNVTFPLTKSAYVLMVSLLTGTGQKKQFP
jgi:hypothetical protein